MAKVLGIDLGTNSLGWAIIDDDMNTIVDIGSRIFSAGVNDLNEKKEESKNVARRLARLTRRQYDRRRKRKRNLSTVLRELNMFPSQDKDLGSFYRMNPYLLRKKGLDGQLTPLEFGRALYQLNQHRGFKSSRKTTSEDEDKGTIFDGDSKNSKPGINSLKEILSNGKYRTIGEYFASIKPRELRIRNRYIERQMFIDEFDKLWEIQQKFYPNILTEKNRKQIRDGIIFFQRPIKSQRQNLGKCKFESNKFRSPKSYPLAQEWRMLQQVNQLRIIGGNQNEDGELSQEQRDILIKKLSSSHTLELRKKGTTSLSKSVAELIGLPKLPKGKEYIPNIDKIEGLKTYAKFSEVLGTDFLAHYGIKQIEKMWHTIYFAEDNNWIKNYAIRTWNLDEETAVKFSEIKPETGYMNVSSKAMRKMLPFLQEGDLYNEAAEKAGYNHSKPQNEIEKMDFLPIPPQLRNPIVNVALGQLRLVVNEIIKRYGKPDIIRVELARDLKQPKSKRIEKQFEMTRNESQRNEIIDILKDKFGSQQVSRDDITKYKLWIECKQICPYTGRSISHDDLFSGEVEVEHILPFSRTLDDSYLNKTLCFREANQLKGNKTPYEAFGGNEEQFAAIKERIKSFPNSKARRFGIKDLAKEFLNEQDFIARQLVDTRYISREATQYLKCVCDSITVSRGSFTSELRHLWGLNSVLGKVNTDTGEISEIKNRDDHRHHAIDAVVIALTTRKMLQARSAWNSQEYYAHRKSAPKFQAPWETLRDDIIVAASNIIISHKINKRVRGQMHEATFYGQMHEPFNKSVPLYDKSDKTGATKYYTVRKRLDAMTANQVYKIVDEQVKQVVFKRLIEKGVDASKLEKEEKVAIPKNAFSEPLYMKSGNPDKAPMIKSVRIRVTASKMFNLKTTNQGQNYNIWVEPGSNHHYSIYEIEDKKGKTKQIGTIVSLFEAYQRSRNGNPIVKKDNGDGSRFVSSLSENEVWLLDKHPDEVNLKDKSSYNTITNSINRIQKITEGKITMIKHTHARVADEETKKGLGFGKTPNTLSGFKIKVDPLGFLEKCDD